MSKQKRYTSQEMCDAAEMMPKSFSCCERYADESEVILHGDDFSNMLRQAADTEEELKLALVTIGNQSDENAQLKARLEAVVDKCKRRMKEYDCGACDFTDEPPWTFERCEIKGCPTRLHAMEFLSILRAARGEGGTK